MSRIAYKTFNSNNVLTGCRKFDVENSAAARFILRDPDHFGEGMTRWAHRVLERLAAENVQSTAHRVLLTGQPADAGTQGSLFDPK